MSLVSNICTSYDTSIKLYIHVFKIVWFLYIWLFQHCVNDLYYYNMQILIWEYLHCNIFSFLFRFFFIYLHRCTFLDLIIFSTEQYNPNKSAPTSSEVASNTKPFAFDITLSLSPELYRVCSFNFGIEETTDQARCPRKVAIFLFFSFFIFQLIPII